MNILSLKEKREKLRRSGKYPKDKMNKNMARSKQKNNQPGERGLFYYQKKCYVCGRLIWGSSPKNRRLASKNAYFKMKAHQEECQKQGKQLKLSVPGSEQKQSETISRVTLTGEKSVQCIAQYASRTTHRTMKKEQTIRYLLTSLRATSSVVGSSTVIVRRQMFSEGHFTIHEIRSTSYSDGRNYPETSPHRGEAGNIPPGQKKDAHRGSCKHFLKVRRPI